MNICCIKPNVTYLYTCLTYLSSSVDRITSSPHCQAVPGTSTQPAKPSSVQSQPWGCVCVRASCFLSTILLRSSPALPAPSPQSPPWPQPFHPSFFGFQGLSCSSWCWVVEASVWWRSLLLLSSSSLRSTFSRAKDVSSAPSSPSSADSCPPAFYSWLPFSHTSPWALILLVHLSSHVSSTPSPPPPPPPLAACSWTNSSCFRYTLMHLGTFSSFLPL